VRADKVREQVLDALAQGRLPAGGPSELAAHGLIDEVPPGYWDQWTVEAAERIRGQATPCTCESPDRLARDGRCSRCWGWPT
jgi:hypothetical protein